MVHLAQIPNDKKANAPLVEGMSKVKLQDAPDTDEFTTSVYGSKFAAEDLPKIEMPEHEMPKEVAYRMIKDDLSLDGNPMLNLASFGKIPRKKQKDTYRPSTDFKMKNSHYIYGGYILSTIL